MLSVASYVLKVFIGGWHGIFAFDRETGALRYFFVARYALKKNDHATPITTAPDLDRNRQGADKGTQYRSAIFYDSSEEKKDPKSTRFRGGRR